MLRVLCRRLGSSPFEKAGGSLHVPGVKHIVAVASAKGGVGKSTTAVNLALALSRLGYAIGLLDTDVYGPSIPRLMNLEGQKPRVSDRKFLMPLNNYGITCMSMGFLLGDNAPAIWRGPMVQSAIEQMIKQVEWGAIDVLVLDLPPGTGDAQLAISQKISLAGAVIVSTPQDIALLDVRRGCNMFAKVNVPVIGVVENMSYYICPNCKHEAHVFGHGGAERLASELGVDFLGGIPLHLEVRETSDSGKPIVVSNPDSDITAMYLQVARKVAQRVLASPEKAPATPSILME
ncbi:mitochondrial Complex I (CI) assembly protein Ind1-like protein [Andalucia godoyi]|uniref:Nucleotide-binding protein-like n=1 Tax=Andalucia godoyi TaxID=505711 RepID=A0A8K0F4D9_ANDGO|nr:mitochondrial Complex I (CI) assembly protein Ind1-like protein [Andalucia godoyi]|eukprot:ANDGO_06092.mRNA.1 mitochondrial Complex I (CI) assembly protein Ind1 homolog